MFDAVQNAAGGKNDYPPNGAPDLDTYESTAFDLVVMWVSRILARLGSIKSHAAPHLQTHARRGLQCAKAMFDGPRRLLQRSY